MHNQAATRLPAFDRAGGLRRFAVCFLGFEASLPSPNPLKITGARSGNSTVKDSFPPRPST
jgi:hypothetical protein